MKTIVIVGPVSAKGGISSVIHAVIDSGEVQRQFTVELVGTSLYRDAPAWKEVGVSARALYRFATLLRSDRSIVLAHIHSSYGVSFYRKSLFALISRAFRIPYVLHVHTGRVSEFVCTGPVVRRWVARRLFRHAARAVVLAPTFERQLQDAFPGVRTEVISNPVTLPADWWGCSLRSGETVPMRVLYVGFFLEAKGVNSLVAAVRNTPPDVQVELRLCGKGPLEAELSRVAATPGHEWLTVVGWLDGESLLREYASASVFALPSAAEGVPMSMLDAMACGLPCVATDVGGIPSILDDGIEGYLVANGDVDALAERLAVLGRSPALRRQMGESAMKRAQAHTPEKIAREWTRLYDTVTDEAGGAPIR